MYLTYQQFQTMGGTLDESLFNDYEFEAESVVDWYTFNRLHGETEYPERLSRLMYHLINLLILKAQAMGMSSDTDGSNIGERSISSQSNDGVSTSYNVIPASELAKTAKEEMIQAIQQYLQGVTNSLGRRLLYRGLYPGE